MSLSAGAQSRLTLRRAAPLHATCTVSLPLFRASGGGLYSIPLSFNANYAFWSKWTLRCCIKICFHWQVVAHKTFWSLPTAFGYPGMLRKIGARNMNETARRWRRGGVWTDRGYLNRPRRSFARWRRVSAGAGGRAAGSGGSCCVGSRLVQIGGAQRNKCAVSITVFITDRSGALGCPWIVAEKL